MIKFFPILFILISPRLFGFSSESYQGNFYGGLDLSDSGEGNRPLIRFQLSTTPTMFRMYTTFTGVSGAGLIQGEISLGGSVYFLAQLLKKSMIQPFVGGEGLFGVGRKDNVGRFDFGGAVGVGLDLKIFDTSGISFQIQKKFASDSSVRYFVGFYGFKYSG